MSTQTERDLVEDPLNLIEAWGSMPEDGKEEALRSDDCPQPYPDDPDTRTDAQHDWEISTKSQEIETPEDDENTLYIELVGTQHEWVHGEAENLEENR